jgi:hypothetical protein
MLYRWRKAFARRRFSREVGGIFDTPPLRLIDAPCSVVSMVSIADLPMYLLAIKSFYRHLQGGRIAAIITRASPARLRKQLEEHVPGIEIVEIESIPVGACQRGGTWERLLYIAGRAEREYVIQLDSDTLTVGPDIPEVLACIAENRSFVLGGGPAASGQRIVSMTEAAASIDFASSYIGIAAQRRLDAYPEARSLRYVRGSSAFAGFARGSCTRKGIEEFHQTMAALLGARWTEWGTEQCASNFAIANAPGARVLPWPDYANFQPARPAERARFLHFLGAVRYEKGCYVRLGRQAIPRIAMGKAPSCAGQ